MTSIDRFNATLIDRAMVIPAVRAAKAAGWTVDGRIEVYEDGVRYKARVYLSRIRGYGEMATRGYRTVMTEVSMGPYEAGVPLRIVRAIDDAFTYLATILFPFKAPKGWRYLSRKR